MNVASSGSSYDGDGDCEPLLRVREDWDDGVGVGVREEGVDGVLAVDVAEVSFSLSSPAR